MRLEQKAGIFCLVLIGLSAAGCTSDDTSDGTGDSEPGDVDSGDTDAGDTNTGDTDGGDTTPDCATGHWIASVNGEVVDDAGSPLAATKAQMCIRLSPSDTLLCLAPSTADESGAYTVDIPATARCMNRASMRVLLPLTDRATIYCNVGIDGGEADLTLPAPIVLNATTRATVLPIIGDADDENDSLTQRTVVFDDGLEIDFIPDDFFGSDPRYEGLAAQRLDPKTENLCFVENPEEITGVYAFSPEGDVDNTAFPIRVPTTAGLAADTNVALYVLGGLSCTLASGELLEEGDWVQYGTGTVSSDGTTITGDPIPCLTWFGYGPLLTQ